MPAYYFWHRFFDLRVTCYMQIGTLLGSLSNIKHGFLYSSRALLPLRGGNSMDTIGTGVIIKARETFLRLVKLKITQRDEKVFSPRCAYF